MNLFRISLLMGHNKVSGSNQNIFWLCAVTSANQFSHTLQIPPLSSQMGPQLSPTCGTGGEKHHGGFPPSGACVLSDLVLKSKMISKKKSINQQGFLTLKLESQTLQKGTCLLTSQRQDPWELLPSTKTVPYSLARESPIPAYTCSCQLFSQIYILSCYPFP